MKKISILIPCYNEEENVGPISEAVVETVTRDLPEYDYELVFIDNDSTDQTRPILRELCRKNPKIKAIFNAKNFGQFNSPYYGLLQVTGDCVISMVADFQDPVELIPKYVREWEKGYKIVIGIKTGSKENPIMYSLRSFYYRLIKKLSDVEQIEHFTGSGLYDRDFIEVLRLPMLMTRMPVEAMLPKVTSRMPPRTGLGMRARSCENLGKKESRPRIRAPRAVT